MLSEGVKYTISIRLGAEIPAWKDFQIVTGGKYQAYKVIGSGLATKNGITVLNTPGTIDSDYRGEIKVILINLGKKKFKVSKEQRIAQMVLCPVIKAEFEEVNELPSTESTTSNSSQLHQVNPSIYLFRSFS